MHSDQLASPRGPGPLGLSRRRVLGVVGAGAIGLAAAGCSASVTGSKTTASAPSSLRGRSINVAAFTKNHAASPLYWPMFAPPGLTVKVTTLDSGSVMNQALEAGSLDFALFGLVNGFVQHEQGIGSKIISMAALKGAGLIVGVDSRYRSVADLRGTKIGVFGPSFQYLLILKLLQDSHLDTSRDVTLVTIPYNDQPAALQRGDVQAFLGAEPNCARSVAAGVGRRLLNPYDTGAGDLNSTIWASKHVLGQPELLSAAALMQQKAADHLSPQGHNDNRIWRDLLVNQFGYSEGVFKNVLPNVGASWNFDDKRRLQAMAQGALMAKLGLLKKEPDYATVFDAAYQPA